MRTDVDELARIAVDTGFRIHRDLGPGLLETVYELILFEKLVAMGLKVDRQKPIDIIYENIAIPAAFRIDLWLNAA